MSVSESEPMKRSQTMSFALPTISKTQQKLYTDRSARINSTKHRSVLLDKIKDMTQNTRYDQMETSHIKVQQKQLQSMLRDFNHQTYNILSKFIEKSNINKQVKKQRSTSTSMMEVKEKQLANSNDALQICKKQMQMLQKKCEYLKYVTYEDFQRKIDSTKAEIQQLRTANKEIIRYNTLRGLTIKRTDDAVSNEVSEIQVQKTLLLKKKERLEQDKKYVDEQIQKLSQNNNKANIQLEKLMSQYQQYEVLDKLNVNQQQLSKQLAEKQQKYKQKVQKLSKKNQHPNQSKNFTKPIPSQNQYDENSHKYTIKTNKTDSRQLNVSVNMEKNSKKISVSALQPPTNNKFQYRYLKLLKQLDEITKKIQTYEQSANEIAQKVQNSKEQIKQYENKLQNMKN